MLHYPFVRLLPRGLHDKALKLRGGIEPGERQPALSDIPGRTQRSMERAVPHGLVRDCMQPFRLRPLPFPVAGVAELADARDLGSRGRKAMQVQLLSPALGNGDW